MKKIFASGLAVVLAFSINMDFSQLTSAKSEEFEKNEVNTNKLTANIPDSKKTWLEGLGFSDHEITNMSKADYKHISEQFKGKSGKLVQTKQEYYKVDAYETSNGQKKVKMVKTTKEKAEKGVKRQKEKKAKEMKNNKFSLLGGNSVDAAWDSENDGWIRHSISVSDVGSNSLAKTSYTWLSNPDMAFSDVIGITHGPNVDVEAGSDYARHWYEDGTGTNYLPTEYSVEKKNDYGYADKFDLKGIGSGSAPHDHSGYMYFEFTQDRSSDNTADLYGHYAHQIQPSWFSISVGVGNISLIGSAESNATDTHVDWTY